MWQPIDTQFYAPKTPVAIVDVSGGGMEFTRATLEELNCIVIRHAIGTPTDFLKVLGQGRNAPRYMIIMGHGTEEGLCFGDYGRDDIDVSMLRDGDMPPEAIGPRLNLPGCTVISYSCYGGSPEMARAFTSGGVAAYIGCRTGPETVAMNLFLFHFLFGARTKGLSDRDAWHRAVAAVDHPDIDEFSFFHADGTEERFVRGVSD